MKPLTFQHLIDCHCSVVFCWSQLSLTLDISLPARDSALHWWFLTVGFLINHCLVLSCLECLRSLAQTQTSHYIIPRTRSDLSWYSWCPPCPRPTSPPSRRRRPAPASPHWAPTPAWSTGPGWVVSAARGHCTQRLSPVLNRRVTLLSPPSRSSVTITYMWLSQDILDILDIISSFRDKLQVTLLLRVKDVGEHGTVRNLLRVAGLLEQVGQFRMKGGTAELLRPQVRILSPAWEVRCGDLW